MHSNFSHIYYEKAALESEYANVVLARFPKAKLIEISDYKDIFNRKRQDWRLQKESLKLILAKKKSEFLYAGSDVTPNFNQKNFYYNTLIMNCIYDCHYCYLQGMYPSANIVIFTNLDDYFQKTDEVLNEQKEMYLSISYDTDLLSFENIVPYCSKWIEFASKRLNIKIELRTKSANYSAIKHLKPISNFVLAWTLSPENIIKRFEPKTPGLRARLTAAANAMADGWQVRLCLDPVLMVDGWTNDYLSLIEQIREALPMSDLHDVSLGSFRMNKDYYQTTRDMRTDSELLHFPYKKSGKMVGYEENSKEQALNLLKDRLGAFMPDSRIFTI